MADPALTDIRPSPIAGQWYPGDSAGLSRTADGYLDRATVPDLHGEIVGLIAPHAGYDYSGPVAGHAFRMVRGRSYDRVAVVSPLHSYAPAPLLTTGHQAYGTPLGSIPVDRDAVAEIDHAVKLTPLRHDEEHSLEIELPFLQRALAGPFSLIPVMILDQSYETAEALGKAVAAALKARGGRSLLVASSDLSHFYTDDQARALDRVMLDCIEAYDPQGVIRLDDTGKAFACGRAAIAAVMVAARELGADAACVVGYGTSGDTGGGRMRVVGYGAVALYRRASEA